MFDFFLFMLFVSAPFLIGIFLVNYFKYRSEVTREMNVLSEEVAELDNAALKKQVEELRGRVEVLEAIVTDRKYDLGERIGSL